MVNKVILVGRLGKDPEMRYTPQGTAVTTLSVATEHRWRDGGGKEQKETEWHTVVAWDKLAEACNQYLAKGRLVYIEGRLRTREWDDDDKGKQRRTEVAAEVVRFLEHKRGQSKGPVEEELPS
jgi:single-strand DNA-binding protein